MDTADAARGLLRIGSVVVDPPLLQAPMAGFSDHTFRGVLRRFGGVGLTVTEMVNARGILEMDARRGTIPARLWGVKDEPRPLAVQIWDNNAESLAEVGARLVEEFQVSVVDINFGCPVKQITEKAESGSYLLQYPDRVGEIVSQVVAACRPAPVTAKIRLGLTRERINAVEVAAAVESAGAAALTIHGRTACDFYRGQADWDAIAEVKAHLRRIPVIGNGDIRTPEAAVEAFRRYGVDGVMIGREATKKPWLFHQAAEALAGRPIPPEPSLDEKLDVLLEHFRLLCERLGDRGGTLRMRRHGCLYTRGYPGARRFRDQLSRVTTPPEFLALVTSCFGKPT